MCYDGCVNKNWGGIMKKRWFLYLGVVILSVIGSMALKNQENTTQFLFYWPIQGFASLLEKMSLGSSFGNFIAWILLLLVCLLPLIVGYLLLKKSLKRFDVISLVVIGITFGITIYYIINVKSVPSWLARIEFFGNEADIKPFIAYGLINVWCGVLLSYLIIRIFIFHQTMGKYFLSLMVFFISFFIMIYIQSLFNQTFDFSTFDLRILTMSNIFDLISFFAMVIFMELIIIFIEHIKDEDFRDTLPKLTTWIKIMTLTMVITSVLKLITTNLVQLLSFDQLNDISFEFNIDMVPWLFVFFFYGLYHYISHANDVMEEAELTI